jgi:outer membrane protein OmpA-like peptidoglycan-associated protein
LGSSEVILTTNHRKKSCWLPLFLGFLALGALGIWGIYFSSHAAPALREATEKMGREGLKSAGFSFGDVQIKNATAIISGVAPDEPAKAAAFAAASVGMLKAQGLPGIVKEFENRIQVAVKPQPVAAAPVLPPVEAPSPPAPLAVADIVVPMLPSVDLFVEPPAQPPVPEVVIPAPKLSVPPPAVSVPPVSAPPVSLPVVALPAPDTCEKNFMHALKGRSINFVTSRDQIMKNSRPLLDRLAQLAKQCGSHVISVEGHTDSRGSHEHNKILSESRARSVITYLVAQGAEAKSLVAIGYGETRPLDKSGTLAGFARNRRIEFKVRLR